MRRGIREYSAYIKDTGATRRFPDLRSRLRKSGQLHLVAQVRISPEYCMAAVLETAATFGLGVDSV